MESKKRSSAKKTTTKRRTARTSKSGGIFKRKAIKPKVKLDTNKVILFCTAVIFFCTILLVCSILIPDGSLNKEQKNESRIEKPLENKNAGRKKDSQSEKAHEKNSTGKIKENKKDSSQEKKQEEKKREEQLALEKKQKEEQLKKEKLEQEKAEREKKEKEELKKQEEQKKLEKFYAEFPDAVNSPKIAVMFDDGGQNIVQLKKVLELKFPITVAVMPGLAHSKESGALVRKSGNELFLHQPMQAVNLKVNPGPRAIGPDMTVLEINSLLKENISEVGPVSGINNHEGSLITEDETRIGAVLQTCDELGISFMDSRTTSQTRVPQAAMSMGYGYYQRDIFLDNEKTRENIIAEVKRGLSIANKKGYVIMIGHVWSCDVLPPVLSELYPVLVKKGYKFTNVSNCGGYIKP